MLVEKSEASNEFLRVHTSILTNFPQLKGNISAICEISKKSIKHVTSNEKSAQNTYERIEEKWVRYPLHKSVSLMLDYTTSGNVIRWCT